jgi:hypothetical protein
MPTMASPINNVTINRLCGCYMNFIDLHYQLLLELIDAGMYLKIDPLVDLATLQLSFFLHVS